MSRGGMDMFSYGKRDATSSQGWMYRTLDRRYFTASWSGTYGGMWRNGRMEFKGNALCSENDVDVTYPYAVIDDFGNLFCVWPTC